MNKKDIEQWTREAGGFDATPEFLAKFAAIVASAEREACANVCEEQMQGKSIWIEGARACSLAIRARGQA